MAGNPRPANTSISAGIFKAEADIIIGPNTSDAVARYIHDNL